MAAHYNPDFRYPNPVSPSHADAFCVVCRKSFKYAADWLSGGCRIDPNEIREYFEKQGMIEKYNEICKLL